MGASRPGGLTFTAEDFARIRESPATAQPDLVEYLQALREEIWEWQSLLP
jgi:hypothetical protein